MEIIDFKRKNKYIDRIREREIFPGGEILRIAGSDNGNQFTGRRENAPERVVATMDAVTSFCGLCLLLIVGKILRMHSFL